MQLLQQLLHLGDTIKELREKQPLQRSSSETSLSSGQCEEDEENVSFCVKFVCKRRACSTCNLIK
jgi:hypothetical protein